MATYIQIGSTVTVGSGGAANIEFTSIPSTYTDLVLKFSARSARVANTDDMVFLVNATSGTSRWLWGTGSAAASGTDAQPLIGEWATANSTASTFTNCEIYIPNYASTTTYKSWSADTVNENNATLAYATMTAGIYSSNTAITALRLQTGSGSNLVQYSTATLYGIKNS